MDWRTGIGAIRRRRWLRFPLWALLWCLVAFPIARGQLAAMAVAEQAPEKALILDSRHARALAGLAEAVQLQGQQEDAFAYAQEALEREPMNVAAMRVQGLALEQAGNMPDADKIMVMAGRLGWRDVPLQLWLMRAYAARGDYPAALRRADALARTEELPQADYAIFSDHLSDDRARAALAQEIADRPFWRGKFFYGLLQMPGDQMPFVGRLIADLARAGSPVTPAERDIYLTRSIQVGEAGAAYAYWLRDQRTAGGKAMAPWDGGFDHVSPAGALAAPFEWQLSPESTGIGSIVSSPSGGHHLVMSPGHDFKGDLVSQTTVLKPGRYAVAARIMGDPTSIGLRWAVRCLPDQKEVDVTAVRAGSGPQGAVFEVPANGCAAQSLAIAIASGDVDTSNADVTVDDVRIRRIT